MAVKESRGGSRESNNFVCHPEQRGTPFEVTLRLGKGFLVAALIGMTVESVRYTDSE
jgi:hypothetical protein